MKLVLMLVGMAAAGLLGYFTEPALRPQLVGEPPASSADTEGAPGIPPLPAHLSHIDPTVYAPEQLPQRVTLKTDVVFSDSHSGVKMSVSSGSQVKLVRVQGKMAVVRPGDTAYTLTIPVLHTDLIEQLGANPPPPLPEPAPEPAPAPTPEPAPAPMPEPTPAPEPAPAPMPEPTPAPEPAPAPMPEPAPATEPEPTPAPAPAPDPEPAPTPAEADPATVVTVMQESIRSGQIKEFGFDDVLSWNAGPNETVDSVVYQTGTVSYKAETLFGLKTIEAKALIQNSKVIRWIWPKSGMEIK